MDRETLHRCIEQRCRQMIGDGLVDEVRRVWELGYGPELPPLQTIGYAQIGDMLQGRCRLEDALAHMTLETRRLAKRQLTWLRAEPGLCWYAPTQTREITAAVELFFDHDRGSRADHLSGL